MSKWNVVVKLNTARIASGTIVTFLAVWVAYNPGHLMLVLAPSQSWGSWVSLWNGWCNLHGLRSIAAWDNFSNYSLLNITILMNFFSITFSSIDNAHNDQEDAADKTTAASTTDDNI
jgi:hypothetical protein